MYFVSKMEKLFQSTPSAWRETADRQGITLTKWDFNPLPPHGGRHCSDNWDADQMDFNPLPPHGGRRRGDVFFADFGTFQSTPSAWRET